MNVIMANAISPNGLLAREDGNEDWLPSEGWQEFLADAKRFNNFVMGRETYERVQELYPDYNFDNVETGYKIIVTRNQDFQPPKGYIVVHSPQEALRFLEEKRIENALLVGGGKLNSQFLAQKLVNEIWITITPYIIGKGRPFIAPDDFDIRLDLFEHKELSGGRLLTKYHCNY